MNKVLITVVGGVATVAEKPTKVEVVIIDWDNHPDCTICGKPGTTYNEKFEVVCESCLTKS